MSSQSYQVVDFQTAVVAGPQQYYFESPTAADAYFESCFADAYSCSVGPLASAAHQALHSVDSSIGSAGDLQHLSVVQSAAAVVVVVGAVELVKLVAVALTIAVDEAWEPAAVS